MSDFLTKDADKTLCIVYKEYLSRCKNGEAKTDASAFESSCITSLFPNKNSHDVYSDLNELKENEFVKMYIDGSFILKSNAIIYMENRFKNGFREVSDFIAKFIP